MVDIGHEVAKVFVIVWAGAITCSRLMKLRGGSICFIQSVRVLGCYLLPFWSLRCLMIDIKSVIKCHKMAFYGIL